MKKRLFKFIIFFLCIQALFAQENLREGKEIENRISAVKAANPGDYILLPSGKEYILTKEEISITKGEFNYSDLSKVDTSTDENGIEIKNISSAHINYVFPDGRSTHVLKTSVSFTSFLRHISKNFYLAYFIDDKENIHEFEEIPPPSFSVFRSRIQYMTISDGFDDLQSINITVYNLNGENKHIRYCSKEGMSYGNIDLKGAYSPVNESQVIEFDVE